MLAAPQIGQATGQLARECAVPAAGDNPVPGLKLGFRARIVEGDPPRLGRDRQTGEPAVFSGGPLATRVALTVRVGATVPASWRRELRRALAALTADPELLAQIERLDQA